MTIWVYEGHWGIKRHLICLLIMIFILILKSLIDFFFLVWEDLLCIQITYDDFSKNSSPANCFPFKLQEITGLCSTNQRLIFERVCKWFTNVLNPTIGILGLNETSEVFHPCSEQGVAVVIAKNSENEMKMFICSTYE